MMEIRDFSNNRNFPGVIGNDFDIILHRYDGIQKIPAVLFSGLLFGIAILPTRADWPLTFGLWGFFLLDWLLLGLLQQAGKSYGPPQPPVLILAVLRAAFAWLPFVVALPLQLIGTLLVVYGFWMEPHRIHTTVQHLRSAKLKTGQTIRLLHLGDLHIERITRREKELENKIKELKPDLIMFSGDVLNLSFIRDPQAIRAARQVMQNWHAPAGCYAVLGSPAVDLDEVAPLIYDGLPIDLLLADRKTVSVKGENIDIIGMSCSHRPFVDAPILESLIDPHSDRFTVLLYHSPDLAPNAARLNIDLQLSGHTHGGQVRLPWLGALFTASLYGRAFASGRYNLKKLVLYITRGIGMEGAGAPRVRFLCPPEIILWEISSQTAG